MSKPNLFDSWVTPRPEVELWHPVCNRNMIQLEKESTGYLEYRIGEAISHYVSPLLFVIGFFGNTLSFIVMVKRSNRDVACCVYLAGLAIGDTLSMAALLLLWIFTVAVKHDGRDNNDKQCRFITVFLQTGSAVSAFTVVAVTVDRFLATYVPMKSKKFRTKHMAVVIEVAIFIVSIVLSLPFGFTADYLTETVCSSLNPTDHLFQYEVIYAITTMMLHSVIPFFVILALNCAIIHKISRLGPKNRTLSESRRKISRQSSTFYTIDGTDISNSDSRRESMCAINGSVVNMTTEIPIMGRQTSVDFTLPEDTLMNNRGSTTTTDSSITPSTATAARDHHESGERSGSLVGNGHPINQSVLSAVFMSRETTEILAGRGRRRREMLSLRLRRASGVLKSLLSSRRSIATLERSRLDRQLSKLLLIISFSFIILTLPQYIRYTIYHFIDICTPPAFARYFLVYHISQKLYLTNSAINFLFYCIGTTRFRQDARHVLFGKCRCDDQKSSPGV